MKAKKPVDTICQWGPFKRMRLATGEEAYTNPVYLVEIDRLAIVTRKESIPYIHARIGRMDLRSTFPRRDLQRIKDELFGTEAEAVEVYPARGRLNDISGERHLWVLAPGNQVPFGFDRPFSDVDILLQIQNAKADPRIHQSKMAKESMHPWHSEDGCTATGLIEWHKTPAPPESEEGKAMKELDALVAELKDAGAGPVKQDGNDLAHTDGSQATAKQEDGAPPVTEDLAVAQPQPVMTEDGEDEIERARRLVGMGIKPDEVTE